MMRAIARCVIALLVLLPLPSLEDVGSRADIAAIRHDLPVLLSTDPQRHPQPVSSMPSIVIDDVSVAGKWALARWHAGPRSARARMERIEGRWWLQTADPRGTGMITFTEARGVRAFPTHNQVAGVDQELYGAVVSLRITFTDASRGTTYIAGITGHRAAENAYLYFDVTLKSSGFGQASGGTMNVWFPWVLDPALRYTLSIASNGVALGPIVGSLRNNALHFYLPSFRVGTGTHLTGQIDADPIVQSIALNRKSPGLLRP